MIILLEVHSIVRWAIVVVGILAITHVPVRMTPEISSVVVSVTTNWENASSEEVESDIVEEQEKVLGEVTGLVSMVSTSAAGQGTIRLPRKTRQRRRLTCGRGKNLKSSRTTCATPTPSRRAGTKPCCWPRPSKSGWKTP